MTCNSCPHQVEGELLDGRSFYFRARHDYWTLSVGNSIDEAVGVERPTASGEDPHGRLSYGDAPAEARSIIEACLAVVVARDAQAAS